MGYFARTTVSSGATSSTSNQVQFTSGATGVNARTDTDVSRVAFHVDGDQSCSGKLHINEVEADTVLETSDPDKKLGMVEMQDIDGQVALQAKPYFYSLKTRPNELHAGVNAKELKEIAPHAVPETNTKNLAVNYRILFMHMLKQIQVQEKYLRAQDKRIKELEK